MPTHVDGSVDDGHFTPAHTLRALAAQHPARWHHECETSPVHRRHRHDQRGERASLHRPRPRRDRAQSRLGAPTAAGGRARARRGCTGCRSGASRDRRCRIRRRRGVPRFHSRARAGRPRPVRGALRAVRVHQLRLGVPEAAAAAADHRVDAAAQSRSGSTRATRSRARTCWSARTATAASRSRSCGRRTPTTSG